MKHLNGESEQAASATAALAATPDEGGAILVVDDNPDEREALAELLRITGFAACTATDGADALRKLDSMSPPPALIVLDLDMPVMNGWQLLDELRAHASRRQIPVIVTSGSKPRRELLGGRPFFPKPLVVDALLSAIRAHLGRVR